jgi:hypothetical protein
MEKLTEKKAKGEEDKSKLFKEKERKTETRKES